MGRKSKPSKYFLAFNLASRAKILCFSSLFFHSNVLFLITINECKSVQESVPKGFLIILGYFIFLIDCVRVVACWEETILFTSALFSSVVASPPSIGFLWSTSYVKNNFKSPLASSCVVEKVLDLLFISLLFLIFKHGPILIPSFPLLVVVC